MVFEKLTLVEFHLETDEFKPSATASVGGDESRSLGKRFRRSRSGSVRSTSGGSGSGGWTKLAPVVALVAAAGAFAVARRLNRR